jgi:hypothetical protein
MKTLHLIVITLTLFASPWCSAAPIRIDLGMDTGRSDTANPGWTEWQVRDGATATRDFGGVKVTLRAGTSNSAVGAGQAALRGVWSKHLLNTGALVAADGVTVDNGTIEIQLDGLVPGSHSLVTYHNVLEEPFVDETAGQNEHNVKVSVDNVADEIKPTAQVANNDDMASGYVEFEAKANSPVIVRVSNRQGNPLINGLKIDGANPRLQARTPFPADLDWHVDVDAEEFALRWALPREHAKRFDLYLTSDADLTKAKTAIVNANHTSPAYIGEVSLQGRGGELHSHAVPIDPNSSTLYYTWRVDSIDDVGKVTKGEVWSFRPRHLAFPGAEGYGRFAIGGRGGRVIKVTNLNDSGPGSLRAAVEAEGPRTVVFDVSGRIVVESKLIMRDPYLTVAGQTAPGKGICISNYNFGMLGNHDCIIRFMRVRPGNTAGVTLDGMGLASCDHSIIDHCSISWTQDESFSSRGAKNITLQRTLISEALNIAGHKKYEKGKQHGFAASVSGDIGSLHHNLLAHCAGRNWSLAGGLDKATRHAGRLDIRNNVVYNWGHRTTDGGAKEVNFVNNYYKPGASTKVFHVLMAQREAVQAFGPQMYYADGNVMEGKFTADEKHAGVFEQRGEPSENWLVDEPFYESFVTTTSAEAAFKDVLSDVGCNKPMLDEHDSRVIDETLHGEARYKGSVSGLAGLPDTQEDVGGWDNYGTDQRSADWDPDNDGLPTWWEELHKLNPNSPADDSADANGDPDGDGFTNLEDYLAWMAAPHYEAKAGASIEVDLAQYARGYDVTGRTFKLGEITNGTAKLNENGTAVSFTLAQGFTGLAKFEYEVVDADGDGKQGHINIRVAGAK